MADQFPAFPLPQPLDLEAAKVCLTFGHHGEGGTVVLRNTWTGQTKRYCVGRCQRCGAGMLSDGS